MNAELLEQLKAILEKNYDMKCSDSEALEIGTTLISYFEILTKNKWKLETNEKELYTNSK